MKNILILLGVFLLLSVSPQTLAQDQTQSSKPATPSTSSETERPKTNVDRLLEEAKARGEIVLASCLENCGDKSEDAQVDAGHVVELVKPAYPALARAAHVSGQVQVQIIIDIDGTVMAAAAVSGHPLLYAASVEAAKKSRFSATKLNGEPVKVTGVISYNFVSQ